MRLPRSDVLCVHAAVVFTQAEQELYIHVFERARAKYHMFRSQGPLVVSKRLIQIMSTLLPLRRICSGGQLSDKDLAVVSLSHCCLLAVHCVTSIVLGAQTLNFATDAWLIPVCCSGLLSYM